MDEAQPREGITFSIVPDVTWTDWDDDTGIENTTLIGGTLSLGFGQFVDLQGYYRRQASAALRAAQLDEIDFIDDALPDQELDVASYGGQIVFSLGEGNVVPILLGGGGVYRFNPDQGDDVRRLKLNLGGGLRATFADWIHGEFAVEGQRYRLDQLALLQFPEDVEIPDDADDEMRTNLSLRAGLGFMLGGVGDAAQVRATDQAFQEQRLTDIGIAIEPFGGVMNFAGETGLSNQELIGARVGADFGPHLGLRAFYWHGMDGIDSFVPLRGWGGEAQFNLSAGQNVVPFLLAGGGQMDFGDDFETPEDITTPSDQTALIVGGGLDFNLGERVRLSAGVRDYITGGDNFAADEGLDDVESPDDLLHNWQYTGAVKFLVGGGGGFRSAAAPPATEAPRMDPAMAEMDWREREIERRAREMVEETALTDEERDERLERLDQLQRDDLELRDRFRGEDERYREEEDRAVRERDQEDRAMQDPRQEDRAMRDRERDELRQMLMRDDLPRDVRMRMMGDAAGMSDDMVMIPAPIMGEIYIRYGEPAMSGFEPERADRTGAGLEEQEGLRIESREALRRTIEDVMERRNDQERTEGAVTQRDLEELEERLNRNFEELLRRSFDERTRQERSELDERDRLEAREGFRQEEDVREREREDLREEEDVREEVEDAIRPRPEDEREPVIDEDIEAPEAVQELQDRFQLSQFRPYVGFAVNDPTQGVFGMSADMGPVTAGSNWNLVPEVSLGIGEGPTSFMAVANLEYQVPWVFQQESFRFDPLVGVGAGLLNHDDLGAVLNLFYGGVLHLTGGGTQPGDGLSLFIAHQGVDIFTSNRLLAGLTLGGVAPGAPATGGNP